LSFRSRLCRNENADNENSTETTSDDEEASQQSRDEIDLMI
jgi:hypothetical protein